MRKKRIYKKLWLWLWLIFALSMLASLLIGASSTNPLDLARALFDSGDQNLTAIFWEVRVPRTLAAALVGIALAQAGWALQAIYSNPIADSALLGNSAIAGVAALITFGFSNNLLLAILSGLALSLFTNEIMLKIKLNRELFIIGAFAIGSGATALIGMIASSPFNQSGRSLTSWVFGSLASITSTVVPILLLTVAIASIWLTKFHTELDTLALGDRTARNLGLNNLTARRKVLAITAVFSSATVSTVGIVGFVGLLVPHFVRYFFPGRHRGQHLAVVIGGAVAVLLADVISRSIFSPVEIPAGITFALFGSPLMFWILNRGVTHE
jgi:iron complex transport system permease protein